MATRRTRITARVDVDRGVFMISVAAELAEMHPQTLRMYESRGLIEPKRSPKGTRLYSQADVERLRRIQEMTTEWGMNLAGVERVFALEGQLDRMQRKVNVLERRAEQLQEEIASLEQKRETVKAEIVRYEAAPGHFTDPYSARAGDRRGPRPTRHYVWSGVASATPEGVAHSASCSAEASRWCVASLMSALVRRMRITRCDAASSVKPRPAIAQATAQASRPV